MQGNEEAEILTADHLTYPLLRFLDIFFLIFHSAWMLFNLFGWTHPRTRSWNLITLLLTGLSWFGMGLFYGWGYCICTDRHWQVLNEMGQHGLPNSYLTYLAERFFGISPERWLVDTIAVGGLFIPLGMNLYLSFRKSKRKKG